jgi:hypothetical protein
MSEQIAVQLQVQRLGMSGYSTTTTLEKFLVTVFISHDSDWMSENHARWNDTRRAQRVSVPCRGKYVADPSEMK